MLQNATEIIKLFIALKLVFLKKKVGFFETKFWIFLKPLKFQRRKVAVKTTEKVKFLKTCKNLAVWKNIWVFRKKLSTFLKSIKVSNIVKSDWNNKISRNVQNLVFSSEVFGFFEKKTCFFQRFLKVENLLQNATVIRNFVKVLKIWD